MENETLLKYSLWLNEPSLTQVEKDELESIKDNDEEIKDRFSTDLTFGTAGLRGKMSLGTSKMNKYTVRKASQGLAKHLLNITLKPSVVIAYDSRTNSYEFAIEAAKVLAANNIKTYIFSKLVPTPTLSFAVRELQTSAGIVITASHNPKEYNGFKVYSSDGAQILNEEADKIFNHISELDTFKDVLVGDFDKLVYKETIIFLENDLIQKYIDSTLTQRVFSEEEQPRNIKIAYTPLNGAGFDCCVQTLNKAGFKKLDIVLEQRNPDGRFITCPYPNPETKEALELGVKYLLENKNDILLATDPDCDRVGVVVNQKNKPIYLSGNEIGMLLFEFLYKTKRDKGTLQKDSVVIKTIVSSDLIDIMAKDFGMHVINVLTGFKYIGAQMLYMERKSQLNQFLFGFEESVGYLSNPNIRDKDAVNACLLIAEMANYYKNLGLTLSDQLKKIYAKYGEFESTTLNFVFDGNEGGDKMNSIMEIAREGYVEKELGDLVLSKGDYLDCFIYEGINKIATNLPSSNVIKYFLKNGETITLRPSGTEPKLKAYIFAQNKANLNKYIKLINTLMK